MLGKKECTDDEIMEALNHAEAQNIINSSIERLNMYVGNKGAQLSGGQKQRIALARAFIRKPKLLILDEATSALDMLTETRILQTISLEYPDLSLIVIAQRLKTVRDLDSINFLQDGQIVERGSFDELMQEKGQFYTLVTASQTNRVVEESPIIPSVATMHFEEEISPDKMREITEKSLIKIEPISARYAGLLVIIVVSSAVSGIAFPLFGYFFAHIMINIFSNDDNAAQKNLDIMAYIIADAAALFISLVLLNYSLAKMFASYTEKIRNDSFASIVSYDSAFFDIKDNSPQRLASILRDESQKISSLGGPVLSIPLLLLFSEIAGFIIAMTASQILTGIKFANVIIHLIIVQKIAKFIATSSSTQAYSEKIGIIVSNSLSNLRS